MNTELQKRLSPLRGQWAEIARLANVDTKTLWRIRQGEARDHRIGTYRRISAAIDTVLLRLSKHQD